MLRQHFFNLFISGMSAACGLIVEIAAGRMVAPYLGMSLYTWTAIIAVVLAGFSVGHWIGGRLADRPSDVAKRAVAWSLLLAGISTIASLVLIRLVAPATVGLGLPAVPTVLIVTTLLFFLPSLFVGIPSPILTKLSVDDALQHESDGKSGANTGPVIGAFYAIGAVGSIGGTLIAGFVLLAWLGITWTLLTVAAAYFVLGVLVLWVMRPYKTVRVVALPAAALVAAGGLLGLVGQSVQAFVDPCQRGSSYYCIRVVDVSGQFGTKAKALVLDHLGHGINLRDAPQRLVSPYVELQDTLARIHSGRRSPFRVFFIGGGAYTLPRAWAAARADAELIVSEIDPAVTKTARDQLWFQPDSRVQTVHADARTALAKQDKPFDVVIGDAFHDIVIPSHLVTREFFSLVHHKLADDGIYLMNVVDNKQAPRLLLSLEQTLKTQFPVVEIWQTQTAERRATFVMAGLRKSTPFAMLESRVTPGLAFRRLSAERRAQLTSQLRPFVLTDDFAPVERLIGLE